MLYDSDETGDAYRYCVALAERAQAAGVEFKFGTEASIEMHSGKVAAVVSGGRRYTADHYVVAAGSYSTLLMQQAGVRLPVRPAKGYSITFENEGAALLGRPIIDHHLHVVIVPFTNAIRVAGTAEFAGYDSSLNPVRVRSLLSTMRDILPQGRWDEGAAKPWCGLRPLSPDGVAIIGPTRVANLWVNSGQGPLGWTCAAGSAQLLSQLMSGDEPGIDPSPYSLARF
jgi:D-amino-acid dehydrogenase